MSEGSDQDRQTRSLGTSRAGEGRSLRGDRRPYVRPRLDRLGDVRDVTLGISPGSLDSNDPDNLQL